MQKNQGANCGRERRENGGGDYYIPMKKREFMANCERK